MTQILAAIILAGGAFYGVYKGAVYATWRLADQLAEQRRLSDQGLEAESARLQRQLDAESERLERQLQAESTRLERQLQAERERAYRSELQELLDDGAAVMAEAMELRWKMGGEAKLAIEGNMGELDPGERLPSVDESRRLPNQLSVYWQRLALRFRAVHPIPTEASKSRQALEDVIDALDLPAGDLKQENLDEFRAADRKFTEAHGGFLFECRARFGVRDEEDQ